MADEVVTSLREDLDAAFEAHAVEEPLETPPETPEPPPETPETPPEPPLDETPEAKAIRERDEAGRFKKGEPKPPETPEPKPVAAKPQIDPKTGKPVVAATPPPVKDRAPQSWKPEAREEWAKLPATVRAEAIRVDREVQKVLQESSEARQGYTKYREAVAPFEQMIRADGVEPLAAVQGLLQTAHMLRYAPPQVKAQGIANMIRSFLPGREGLELLDRAILAANGGVPPGEGGAPPGPPQQFRDPRLDEVLARMEQARQAQEATDMAEAKRQIEEIQGEEFYNDVREDMADLIEVMKKRGVVLSVRDAYNRAIRLNPATSKVLDQREAGARRNGTDRQAATQRARAASVSVRSTPIVPPKVAVKPEGSLRDDLEAAMEAVASAER